MANLETEKQRLFAKIPVDSISLKNYNDVSYEMDNLVWAYSFKPVDNGAMAYATRMGSSKNSYKVYVYNGYKNARECLAIHEFGHCIYQHLKLEKTKSDDVRKQIMKHWDSFKKHIDMSKVPEGSEVKVSDAYVHTLSNIAMDMEVNSKVFADDERAHAFNVLCNAAIHHAISNATTLNELSEIEKYLDDTSADKKPFAKFIDPQDYGFPLRLNWMAYISLLLEDEEKALDAMKDMIDPTAASGSGDSSGGSSSSGKGIDAGDLMDYAESCDTSEEISEKENGGGSGEGGSGRGRGRANSKSNIAKMEANKKISAFIKDICISPVKLEERNDILHYYNRKRFNSDVLYNKKVTRQIQRTGDVVILIDVSGSVKRDLIDLILNTTYSIKNKIGKKSRIITWDSYLENDIPVKDIPRTKINSGGGTDIYNGIHYVKENKYVSSANDTLLIVSDFFDDLDAWDVELTNFKGKVYAIDWADGECSFKVKNIKQQNILKVSY